MWRSRSPSGQAQLSPRVALASPAGTPLRPRAGDPFRPRRFCLPRSLAKRSTTAAGRKNFRAAELEAFALVAKRATVGRLEREKRGSAPRRPSSPVGPERPSEREAGTSGLASPRPAPRASLPALQETGRERKERGESASPHWAGARRFAPAASAEDFGLFLETLPESCLFARSHTQYYSCVQW